MMRSLLPGMVIATFISLLLLSAIPAPDASASEAPDLPGPRYRLSTVDDLLALKAAVGVRDPGTDYNIIIGGFGTGLAPPSELEWDLSVGTMYLDLGADNYEVPLASSLDLSAEPYFPEVRSQGSEGSCAAFSLTYYNYGYIEAKDNGWSGAKAGNNSNLLAPSWTYNKINGAGHEGSSFQENARIIKQLGAATWTSFPYSASDDEGLGPEIAWRTAPSHRISAYTSVYNPSPSTVVSLIKEQLGLGRPISFAMDANQYTAAFADGNYIMTAQEYSHVAFNHGQTIVGYDDAMTDDGDVGAFKVVNSWGKSWGQNGYYYVTYEALKEMLGAPLVYLTDIADHRPTMLATWTFSQPPSVDGALEVGAGSGTSPIDKVSTYLNTGSSNLMCTFMAIDASSLKDEYGSGTGNFYLKLGGASTSGVASSFQLELFQDEYLPTSGAVVAASSEVPKAVPGTVNAGLVQTDVIPPASSVAALPECTNSSLVQVHCAVTDAGGSGLDHWELFYRFNSLGSYARYAPSSNPSGNWTSEGLSFDTAQVSGQGYYEFYSVAEDGDGNREQAPGAPDTWTSVDLDAPISTAVPVGEAGQNGWYVSTVTLSIVAEDQLSGVEGTTYRVNGGIWYDYTSALHFDQGVHLLEFRSVDRAGNWEGAKSLELKVDTVAPSIAPQANLTAVNGWYRSTVGVTASVSDAMDDSCSLQFQLDGGGWTDYTGTIAVAGDGEHLLEFESRDDAGNLGQASMTVRIDTNAPESLSSVEGEAGSEGRYLGPVTVVLSGNDEGSGIEGIHYRLDGGTWYTYSAPLQLEDDGTYLLEHYAVDVAGNEGPVTLMEVLIDSNGPSVSIEVDRQPSSHDWYDGPVVITLVSSDHFDQGCLVYYRWDRGEWSVYIAPLEISSEGVRLLECYAVDLAGNQGPVVERTFSLDLSAPACSAEVTESLGTNGIYVSGVRAVLTALDQGSGVAAAYCRLNGGPWGRVDGPLTVTAQGYTLLEFYAVDLAGNAGPAGSASFIIDTIAPSVLAETDVPAKEGWFASEVSVSLFPDEEGCSVLYRIDLGDWTEYDGTVTISGNGPMLLEFKAADPAGNQGPIGQMELWLDSMAPQVSATLQGTEGDNSYYVSSVNVSVVAEDEGSGVSAVWFRVDGGDWALWNGSLELDADGDRILEMYALDIAGNQGGTVRVEVAIDTHAPRTGIGVLKQAQLDGRYLNNAPVALQAEDAESGVSLFMYKVDDGPWMDAGENVIVQGEGLHAISCFAVDAAGNNASAELSIEIVLPLQAPLGVQNLTATVTDAGILLAWSPSATGLEAGYQVYRSVDGQEVLVAEIMTTSYLDENVSEGVEYDYRVVPVNNVGVGPSALVLGMTLPTDGPPLSMLLSIALAGLGLVAVFLIVRRR